jgi:hypothetical protein
MTEPAPTPAAQLVAHVDVAYLAASLAEARALANSVKRVGLMLLAQPAPGVSVEQLAEARNLVISADVMLSAYQAAQKVLTGKPLPALAPHTDRPTGATTLGDTPR